LSMCKLLKIYSEQASLKLFLIYKKQHVWSKVFHYVNTAYQVSKKNKQLIFLFLYSFQAKS